MINSVLIHVPVILLCASAEFNHVYHTYNTPRLAHISENDQQMKASSLYHPAL